MFQGAGDRHGEAPVCPITGDRNTRLLQSWTAAEINRLWSEDIGIDTTANFDDATTLSLWHAQKSDLQFFHPIVTGDERFYEQLHKKNWYFQPNKWEFHEASRHIAPSHLVLDLGAGRQPFRSYVAPGRYNAIDAQIGETETAHAKYDVVCAFQVLEHVADPLEFVTIIKSWLKPGGLIFIGVPNRESYLKDLQSFPLELTPHHVTRWSQVSLAALASATGLQIEEISQSPLESWEVALYWMTRLERVLPHPAKGRYWMSRRIAYATALGLSAAAPRPHVEIGSSLLMRSRSID